MSTPSQLDTREARSGVARWTTSLAALVRHAPQTPDPATGEASAFARLALRTGDALKMGAGAPDRADLLGLALVNVRAAVVCLTTARQARHAAERSATDAALPLEKGVVAIVDRSITGDMAAPPSQLRRDLELLLPHAERLLAELEAPMARAHAARRRAWGRALAPLVVSVVLVTFASWALFRPRDVSAGKPWSTSSSPVICDPTHKWCAGAHTSILFHTNEEDNPWFEIDLGTAQEVTSVEVRNRTDCCAERAVPLVVEVSLDHEHYRTVARRFATFDRWSQKLPSTPARYVRLRVARHSILHLEQVRIFGRETTPA